MKLIKVKTSELTGAALDYAVAVAQGRKEIKVYAPSRPTDRGWIEVRFNPEPKAATVRFDPTISWGFGGPIIEQEQLQLDPIWDTCCPGSWVGTTSRWCATSPRNLGGLIRYSGYGPTPLIAAMRCFVESKRGNEVEVPESLVKH